MKAAIFDLFGTLVPCMSIQAQRAMLNDVAGKLSAPREDVYRLWAATSDDRATGRLPSLKAAFEHITTELDADPSRVEEAMQSREKYIRDCLKPRGDALSALRELKAAGFSIGLVSNCSNDVPTLWSECPLSELSDAPIFSPRVGARKPDRKIFQSVLDALEVPAARCVYIADEDSGELAAASAIGMGVIHLLDPSETPPAFLRNEPEVWTGLAVPSITEAVPMIAELLAAR